MNSIEMIEFAARLLVGGVLVGAGLAKISRLGEFRKAVDAFQMLPVRSTSVVAPVLVATELVAGSLLLIGVQVGIASLAATSLFVLFAIAISVNLLRGHTDLTCGCFGGAGIPVSWKLVLRDLALASAASMPAVPQHTYSLGIVAIVLVASSLHRATHREPAVAVRE